MFFFRAKKSRSLFCLVVRRFPGFLNFFKLFFQEALAPWHHFSETQGIGCTAPAKTQFSRKPPGLYRSFPRHPSEYILRWVGVLGCMFFFGSKYWTSGAVFGCLGFWTEFLLRKDLPKQRWTLKGILDPHCWKLLNFGQNLPVKGFRVKMCKGL